MKRYSAEHASLHVIEQMAVKGPRSRRVGSHEKAEPLAGFDVDRVFVGPKLVEAILKLAPETVQVDRMVHHRVVD